jgi:CRP-like cAMP-binding protein
LVLFNHAPYTANGILASLPPAELDRLLPDFELLSSRHGELLQEAEETMEFVFFPVVGMISMLTVLEDGESIEAATIGPEGIANVQVFLGASLASGRLVTQLTGRFLRMRSDKFRTHLSFTPQLRVTLARYVDALFTLVAQSAACNRLHTIDKRCARWLLMTRDRAEGDEFELTQEFLSQMLGVRRASVSVSAAALQDAGLIRYRHGKVTIVDRPALEAASCECYGVIQRRFGHMSAD